jgi:ketosteroid isomerase-like protein
MKKTLLILLLGLISFNSYAIDDPRTEDRNQLLVVLSGVEKALNDQDFNAALKFMDKNVLVTYYNAEVTVGHKDALAFYTRMISSAEAVVKEHSSIAKVGAPATFYGNTAVAYGTSTEKYKLTGGLEFELLGHWTATILKKDEQWKIISLHFSTNLFDNALLNKANQMNWVIGGIMFFVGVIIMLIVGRLRK